MDLQITEDQVTMLKHFTILLYNQNSSNIHIDEACQKLFTIEGWAIDTITPTRAALLQHIRRALYQGKHCWG